MSVTGSDERIETMLAKQEIREVVMRYCRGIDRMDEALVRSCYHPDATDEHGSFSGGLDEFVAFAWKLLRRCTSTMHFIGNMLIEVQDDAARSESYGIAFHRSDSGEPEGNLVTGFRFIDRFERRQDGVWRIARRIATTEWVRVDAPEHHWPMKETLRTGRRDGSDPVYDPIC